MTSLIVTSLGTHHDNPGLWGEGFQPDDNLTGGSSFATNAHQETWPLGLFYSTPVADMDWGKMSTGLVAPTPPTVNYLWDLQYNGSELTNITNPPTKRGTPLDADSEQHYKLIQGQLLKTAIDQSGRAWDSQIENSQTEYFNGSISGSTNTADDGGASYSQIETEMMSASGNVWNNSNLTYNDHEGGSTDGLLGNPTNPNSTATFQAFQIYSKNLLCACSAPTSGGPTPLDLCNDPNSLNYWQFTGQDCSGTPIPADLWNGSATLGSFGCTNCDYELALTSCTSGCDCVKNSSAPVISTTEAAPTTLGGNDGVLNIEIATGGIGAFVYFIEPLGNTSAGLGIGAVEDYTLTGIGGTALTANGIWTYTYNSGSAAGTNLKVEVVVDNYNASTPTITLNKFIQRGSGYIGGESNVLLENVLGGTITVTINTVAGVVVSPYSLNDGKRHYEFTDASCAVTAVQLGRKVTLGTNVYLEHTQSVGVNNYGSYLSVLGQTNLAQFPPQIEPYKYPDFFKSYAFNDSNDNNYPITGIEAGDYKITVFEGNFPCDNGSIGESAGCFAQKTITIPPGVNNNNGCTDNNAGTNDGVGLNYDAAFNIDDGSCIYCRAVDGKLVDNTSTELSVSGSTNPGDILTSTNNSIVVASTDSTATDGSISYSRSLNSIMNYYAGLITNNNGTPNAEFKMELYSRSSSAQTLTGASLVGAPVTNTGSQGFNKDFDNISWSQGLTYGYYAIKSYVNDPQSGSEQEDCFQVDYFIVPVLACIIGQSGMQVGITLDNVTITDLDLVVASIPGNNLNPCTLQCCDAPIVTDYLIQTSPSCGTPAFNISQSCPNGIEQYITNTVHDIEFSSDNGATWSNIYSQSVSNFTSHSYTINIYNAYGPGDYRVVVTRTFTWANGTTSQCIDNSNSVSLTADICGCTDPNSLNFDPLAVIDDGSCTYCIDGCMDPTSLNYNSLATCDDGSCMGCVYGCMDAAATNYNAFATCDDGSCNYGVGCGCTDVLADNYGYDQSGNLVGFPPPCSDGSCEYGGVFCVNPPNIGSSGTTDATCLPSCNIPFIPGCTDSTANNYDPTATIDDSSCAYGMFCPSTALLDGSTKQYTVILDPVFEHFIENEGPGGGGPIDGTVCTQFLCDTPAGSSFYGNTQIGIYFPPYTGTITDVTGIEDFCKLEKFISAANHITSINFHNNPLLNYLQFFHNRLTSIDLSDNPLLITVRLGDAGSTGGNGGLIPIPGTNLTLYAMPLASINLGAINKIETLSFNMCSVSNIDLTNLVDLVSLSARQNQLTSLDISQNTKLTYISLTGLSGNYFSGTPGLGPTNNVSSLDTSNNPLLKTIYASANAISSFDFTNNTLLETLHLSHQNSAAGGSNLTTLDVSMCPNLKLLKCSHNELTTLNLGSTIDLTTLDMCAGNQYLNYNVLTPTTMNLKVGVGDVPGTTGGTGAGGLQTRVEWATANWTGFGVSCSSGFTILDNTVNITT
jgi:hypothetical protein